MPYTSTWSFLIDVIRHNTQDTMPHTVCRWIDSFYSSVGIWCPIKPKHLTVSHSWQYEFLVSSVSKEHGTINCVLQGYAFYSQLSRLNMTISSAMQRVKRIFRKGKRASPVLGASPVQSASPVLKPDAKDVSSQADANTNNTSPDMKTGPRYQCCH